MLSFDDLCVLEPNQIYLKISEEDRNKALQQSRKQAYSNDAACRRAYQNELLKPFERWLETELDLNEKPKIWSEPEDLPSFWEIVNGTIITMEKVRLLVVPDETDNFQQLHVPQEWVDIPEWATDYYIAIQQNLEDCWLKVVGYATHAQLKREGMYDPMDRTYCLDHQRLIPDLNVLSIAQEFSPHRKLAIDPIPNLSEKEAVRLINQLSQPSLYSPRLDIPFAKWAALIANPNWRQQLYQQRTSSVPVTASQTSPKTWVKLSQWAQETLEAGKQALDDLTGYSTPTLATARGSNENEKIIQERVTLGDSVVKLIVICERKTTEQELRLRIKVQATDGQVNLPPNLKLSVFDESETNCEEVTASDASPAIELLPLLFDLEEKFTVQITLEGFKFEKKM